LAALRPKAIDQLERALAIQGVDHAFSLSLFRAPRFLAGDFRRRGHLAIELTLEGTAAPAFSLERVLR